MKIRSTHLSLATSHCDIDESSGVCDSLLRSALRGLLLLLRLDLYTILSVCCRIYRQQ